MNKKVGEKIVKVIMIASGKGGTGKTLSSINLSLALNYLNHKVLLIDGNLKKPNLFHHFNLPHEKNLHDMYKNKYHPEELIKIHPSGLKIIFGGTKIEDFDNINYERIVKAIKYFKTSMKDHDFIFIDTAPNFGSEFFHSAKIADETIIVTHPNKISIHETLKTIKLCEDEGASVIGVIINAHGSNEKIDENEIQRILKRPILGIIPHDNLVEKSIKIGHPVVCSYPNSKISKNFKLIGQKFSDLNRHTKNERHIRKSKK